MKNQKIDECQQNPLQPLVMPSSMIISSEQQQSFNICPGSAHLLDGYITPEAPIPKFYSAEHAHDEGWRYTKDIKLCKPDLDGVWICPKCVLQA